MSNILLEIGNLLLDQYIGNILIAIIQYWYWYCNFWKTNIGSAIYWFVSLLPALLIIQRLIPTGTSQNESRFVKSLLILVKSKVWKCRKVAARCIYAVNSHPESEIIKILEEKLLDKDRVNSENISISVMYPEHYKMFPGYFEPEMIDGDLRFYITWPHYVIITLSASIVMVSFLIQP